MADEASEQSQRNIVRTNVASSTAIGDAVPETDSRPHAPAGPPRNPSLPEEKSRLGSMPLAVLLPQLGELRGILPLRGTFEVRLEEIHVARSERELTKGEVDELAMIETVLAWLDAAGGRQA